MFGDMMGKMKEAQQKMEEAKKRLDSIYVDVEVENGAVKITATGNKKIKNITLSDTLLSSNDKEAIEELLMLAVNRVLEKAESVNEAEMQNVAKGMLPGF